MGGVIAQLVDFRLVWKGEDSILGCVGVPEVSNDWRVSAPTTTVGY